jgi:Outer membrane protein beta-barrel domain
MRAVTVLAVIFLFGLSGVRPASGQQTHQTDSLPEFELTAFLGYRLGGSFDVQGSGERVHANDDLAFGGGLSVRLDETQRVGLFYSKQPTTTHSSSGFGRVGLSVEYFHLDETVESEQRYRFFTPYLTGALGVTVLSVDAPGTNSDTRFSIAVGGGLRFPVRPRFDVRLDARAYLTFIDTNSSVFCAPGSAGGACALRSSSPVFVQYEFLVGAAYSF